MDEVTDAGIAAEHAEPKPRLVRVAPVGAQGHNTLRPALEPIACWAIGDERFGFGSSFVAPRIADDVRSLAALHARLERRLGGRPLAVLFGHADPVGKEAQNKALSGRRAAAVYGLLTRRVDIWEDLFSQGGAFAPKLADDSWGESALDAIRADLGAPKSTPRATLFADYMDKHGRDRAGARFSLAAPDFLAGGAEPSARGDVQGCGEWNPLRILSDHEDDTLPQAQRDLANAPNRRVTLFWFAPGTQFSSERWPCPSVSEGTAKCRARLWSDADTRLARGAARRERPADATTFGCRFYDRLAARSPCERVMEPVVLQIRLFDAERKPMASAPFRVTLAKRREVGRANDQGIAELRARLPPRACLVEWGETSKPDVYRYRKWTFLEIGEDCADPENARRRLYNLGYSVGLERDLEDQPELVREFKRDCGARWQLPDDAMLDQPTRDALVRVHDDGDPPPRAPRPESDA